MHDRPTLERGVDVAADRIPCLPARKVPAACERPFSQTVEAIVLRRPLEDEDLPRFEAGTWAALRIRQVLLLQVGKHLGLQDRHLAFDRPLVSQFALLLNEACRAVNGFLQDLFTRHRDSKKRIRGVRSLEWEG